VMISEKKLITKYSECNFILRDMSINKFFNKLIIIFLVVFVLGVGAQAEPVAYWRWENSSVSEYNSPTVDAALGTTSGYSTDVPGSQISDGVATYANTASYDHGASGTDTVVSDYAVINSGTCYGEFTIEAFIKMDEGANYNFDTIINNSDATDGWYFGFWGDGQIAFWAYDGYNGSGRTALAADPLTGGVWHHVAVVGTEDIRVDQAFVETQIYVDYLPVGTVGRYWQEFVPGEPYISPATNPFTIGTGGNAFDGLIDDLRITSAALEPSEFLRVSTVPTSCAEVWQFGYGISVDINKDCMIDLLDLEILVLEWLECNDPSGCP